MILIGSGALLVRALETISAANIPIECVICPKGEPTLKRLIMSGMKVIESENHNYDLALQLLNVTDANVLSINNKTILVDELLSKEFQFFNIHNGLTQRYRGIAEVCVFAAICHGAREYGATLHRIKPKQLVDTGPIISQSSFVVPRLATFESLFAKSLENVQTLLTSSLSKFAELGNTCEVDRNSRTLNYGDIKHLVEQSPKDRVIRACELGIYRGLLPKLASAVSRALPL